MKRRIGAVVVASAALVACPHAPELPGAAATSAPKGSPASDTRARARGMLAAAGALSTVAHDYILDPTSSYAPGRGLQRTDTGLWSAVPTACAAPHVPGAAGITAALPSPPAASGGLASGAAPHAVDAATIDYGFVGVAVDSTLVAADADLTPYFSAGGSLESHKIRLVAIAFVRDLDAQFFDATDDVAYAGAACTCGRATHFVGAVKMGGMLSYDVDVHGAEAHGRALDFVQAKLAGSAAEVSETSVGGLEVDGLESIAAGKAPVRRLSFRVTNPVPIAYAVYPLADVCRFSLPEPQVAPEVVDFGLLPYGHEAKRLLHVVNRATIDVTASFRGNDLVVPARGSADLETSWTPDGDAAGCDDVEREETLVFGPADPGAPVTPKRRTVRVVEHAQSGPPSIALRQHEDTGVHRAPDYAATAADASCPPDFVVASCRAENAACSDKAKTCTTDGFAITATPTGNGCRFACQGPTSLILPTNFCRFDGVTECRLRCAR